eukprot:Gb_14235 [translate_table: standard]
MPKNGSGGRTPQPEELAFIPKDGAMLDCSLCSLKGFVSQFAEVVFILVSGLVGAFSLGCSHGFFCGNLAQPFKYIAYWLLMVVRVGLSSSLAGFVVFLRRRGCLGGLFLEASPTAGQGRKLIGTFSATDLRGCPAGMLQSWLSLSVLEFTERSSQGEKFGYNSTAASTTALINTSPGSRLLVTCLVTSPLEEVISKAVDYHVHRVWVVDQEGLLIGLVALSDILRSFRAAILAQDNESPGNQP